MKRPALLLPLRTLLVFTLFLLSSGAFALLFGAETAGETRRQASFFSVWALPRVWAGAILGFLGVVLLMTRRASAWMRFAALLVIFFAFSIISLLPWGRFAEGMGLHPSPMCTIEKPLMFVQMGRSVPIVFFSILGFILLMTLVANKLFCGWNCPIGALQELLHRIPLPRGWKGKLPFRVTNAIRIAILLLFTGLLFGTGFSLYSWLNPFEFLHWRLEWAIIPAFAVTFIGALFFYRPFCYLVCPVGLVTWLAEHFSILRVRLDKKACTDCMICVKKSPCPTVPAILAGKRSRPDCHACGACIEACPEKALRFK
ncbi:MAG TPA: 4Fe-4S binding protein [bacterium]|nr:4Fe-4S binding protein [bacterium]HPR89099.1 4Fe-4S binding protein [bacterium]